MSKAPYVLPKVWKYEAPSGGQFASINRPPQGRPMKRYCR